MATASHPSPFCRAAYALAYLALCLSSRATLAAQVPQWTVAALDGKYEESFYNIKRARELSDGRLLVLEHGFFLLNLSQGVGASIGRSGDGPGEYRAPLQLFAFRGDTSAYYDMVRPGKVTLILPSGQFGERIDLHLPSNTRDPAFGDGRGGLYSEIWRHDSFTIVRRNPPNAKVDTVGRLSHAIISSIPRRADYGLRPFETYEQWLIGQDGRFAVVSVEPYRVTFYTPDGKASAGPELPTVKMRVTEVHRREWLAKAKAPRFFLAAYNGGPMTAVFSKTYRSEIEPPNWPTFLPPFLPGAVSFAQDGMLWVQRTTADPSLLLVDIVDRQGRLAGQLALPKGRSVLCHGKDSVYLIRTDEDDLQYIERYRLPAGYKEVASH